MLPTKIHATQSRFRKPTTQAKELKAELEKRGVKAYLELHDGHKHIDISLPETKLNIEVDGLHHLTNPYQIVSDISRGYYSNKKGYHTLHIQNQMLHVHMNEIADGLSEAEKICKERIHIHVHLNKTN